ncbi:2-dehydro-3-deoxyphosphooctonate aldolase-like [Rosa chinensis]|uniref:2-dehydro-3-deoxyphosphooctonate aldolase-like n=1 Tax=Rosa chinensis TaxID=74649 RepID=UPI001AD91E91|nr:2-dehydro-3-deoxyphosphooctonate aldolase-like [Rosa chinensis]
MFSCGGIRSYQEHCSSSSQEKQIPSKVKVGLPLVFKSSFDKANRTSSKSFRGPGMAEGLKILKKVKIAFDLPIVTNVHEFIQCEEVGKLSLQISFRFLHFYAVRRVGQSLVAKTGALSAKSYSLKTRSAVW